MNCQRSHHPGADHSKCWFSPATSKRSDSPQVPFLTVLLRFRITQILESRNYVLPSVATAVESPRPPRARLRFSQDLRPRTAGRSRRATANPAFTRLRAVRRRQKIARRIRLCSGPSRFGESVDCKTKRLEVTGPPIPHRADTRRDCRVRARDSISHRAIQRADQSFRISQEVPDTRNGSFAVVSGAAQSRVCWGKTTCA